MRVLSRLIWMMSLGLALWTPQWSWAKPKPTPTPTPTPVEKTHSEAPNSAEEVSLLLVQQNRKTEVDPQGLAQAGVGLRYWNYPKDSKSPPRILHLEGAGLTGGNTSGVYVEGEFLELFGKTAPLLEKGLLKHVRFAWGTGAETRLQIQDERKRDLSLGMSLTGVMLVADHLYFGPEVTLDYGTLGDGLNTKAGLKAKYLSPEIKITGEIGGRTSWREPSAQDYLRIGAQVRLLTLRDLDISVQAEYTSSTTKYLPLTDEKVPTSTESIKEIRLGTAIGF